MYRENKNTSRWFTTPFMQSVFEIPAWVIFCNAAGKISEEELHASV